MDNKYIKIDFVISKEEGWKEEESNILFDKIIDVIEEHKGQAGGGFEIKSETALEEEYEQNNIILKFDSEENRQKWIEWYLTIGEPLSQCIINHDLNEDPPWENSEEYKDIEFDMVFK